MSTKISNLFLFSIISLFCIIGIVFYMYKTNKKLNFIAQSCNILKTELTSVLSNITNHNENLSCNLNICLPPIAGREEFFKLLPDLNKIKSLEIAPWFNPILIGDNVKYFDVYDKKTLIEKAIAEKLDISKIPEISYTHPEGDMSLIKEKFSLIFSSHNIEHQVDLVKHLNQVANLLEEGGKFFIAIPDKRYCFDHHISITPLSEVLAIYWQKPKVHSLQTILSMRCETTHNDSTEHWKGNNGEMSYKSNVYFNPYNGDKNFEDVKSCFFDALKEFEDANGAYIDSHKWRFTPESFYNIVNELYKMKLQPLKIEKVFCTAENSNEFYVILYKP